MPFALRKVYAAAPPIITLSAFGRRCSSAPILSFILTPPTTSVKGLIGFSLIIERYSNSLLRLAGFSLSKELEYLSMMRENPIKPFTLVVGGVKIKDKIGALEHLLPKADKVMIGGAAAYTFLKAKGIKTGNSLIDEERLPWVAKALSAHSDKIMLPTDYLCATSPNDTSVTMVKGDIPNGMSGFDIGNETIEHYSAEVGGKGGGT